MVCILKTLVNKSYMLLFTFLLINAKTQGQQNLVPNGDLETITNCFNWVVIPKPPPCTPWLTMVTNTGSYANACANTVPYPSAAYVGVPNNTFGYKNYQYAHSGNGYLIFKTLNSNIPLLVKKYKGYQEVKLSDSLKVGKKYYCGFYVVLTDSSQYATNNIAMSITKNIQTQDTSGGKNGNLNANPNVLNYNNPIIKDTQNWVLISSIYTAKGGEQYITIGNFKDNSETAIDSVFNNSQLPLAVYCLDDVFVYELNNSYCERANAGRDTTIKQGDSVFIGSYTNGIDSIKWLLNGNVAIDSTRPGFWVKPLASSFYVVQQTVNGCFSADTVFVNVQPLPLKFITYNVISRNEKSLENLWQTANEINVSYFNILKSVDGVNFKVIGKIAAKNKSLNEYSFIDKNIYEGLNYYKIIAVDKDGKVSYSEVRTINLKPQTLTGISIYPNPVTNGNFTIAIPKSTAVESLAWYVTITDIYGKKIMQKQLNAAKTNIEINTAKGIYMATVYNKNSGKHTTTKIIVQ